MMSRRSRLAGTAAVLGLVVLFVAPVGQASPGEDAGPRAKSATTRALDLMPKKVKAGLDIRFA